MKNFLPFLLAGGLLLTGCSKSSDDPQPTAKVSTDQLQGRWQLVSDVRTVYTTTGTVASTTPSAVPAGTGATITATEYIGYVGSASTTPIAITRISPTLIQFGSSTAPSSYKTIVELTDHRLVWTTPVDTANPPPYPAIFTTTYTR